MYDNRRAVDSVKKNRCACCLKPFLIDRRENCSDCAANSCLFCHKNKKCVKKNDNCLETVDPLTEFSESSIEFRTTKVEHVQHDLETTAGDKKEENSMEIIRDTDEKMIEELIEININPINRTYHHSAYKSTTNTASMAQMALKELVERVVEEAKMLPGLRSSKAEKEKENSTFEDLLATAILNKVIEKFQNDYVDGNRNILSEISPNKKKNSEIETSFEKGQEQLSLTIEERIEEVEEENDVDFSNTRRVPFPEFGMDIVSQDSSDENQEQSVHDHITPLESWEENWLFQKRKMQIRSDPVSMLVPYPSEDYRALIGDKNVEDISSDDEIEHELKFVISSATESSDNEEANVMEKLSSTFLGAFENGIEKLSTTFGGDQFFENGIEMEDNIEFKKGDNSECKKENEFECKTEDNDECKAGDNFECEKEDNFHCKKKENFDYEKGDNFKFVKENNFQSKKENFEYEKKENFECKKKEENFKSKQNEMFFNEKNETEEMSAEDQVQQESEYTEHFDTATQKHMDSLTKMYGPMGIDEVDHESSSKISELSLSSSKTLGKCRDSAAFIKGENLENEIEDEVELATPPRPGTIAEREHRKWENARPIKNNPYSKKNIQKRLLERQYNCYSIITESNISKSSDKPLQIVLGAKTVDFKRFARDYYINDAITSNEEKQRDLETNQHSKIEDDIIDYESNSLVSGEGQLKVSNCQKNNEEAAAMRSSGEIIIPSQSWKNSDVEKLFEKERRNNKNEINARFNNKDSKNHCDINYETSKSSQQRVINKLDLKSFGYECGLRRTQSIQFDSRNHSQAQEQKPKIVKEKNEFNSSEIENDDDFQYPMSGIFSAKSVPNIADIDFSNDEKQNRRKIFVNSVENLSSENSKGSIPILPSVRKLARAFSKSTEINSSMLKMEKKRPTTPEILLVEKPRQLEQNSSENERNAENNKSSIGDISIISPGKLKNNIQFWEQLQKQS
ncbi:uncharacterized protein LOC122507052 isoform X2 [Leptopilina heterotoma]|uniref:uncharacterized protein LOC122507052 isoform X2 n=1 Tax=Leptopilina heterotoma TaxID=63436 RepID=UPI001CA8A747|nr:uncharacterized protein LOC122507052 isoform X2 [Leptopilina heterotoma]